jgi:thiol-disulfide isomerase/thioredoxin
VIGTDGLPAAGKRLQVSWFDGHYGSRTIFEGPIPADGVVSLVGISDQVPTEAPFGPYGVKVEGESVGFFRVMPADGPQNFEFRLVPKTGDPAPNVELVALETEERVHLRDMRGKIVFLEFWETGCGPCQPMMAKLNELVEAHAEQWQDHVAVLPVGLDANREILASHVESRGWTNLNHYWSPHSGGEYFADAGRAYVVHSVPTALLIDRNGKIVWRGHPSSLDLAAEIEKLVAP